MRGRKPTAAMPRDLPTGPAVPDADRPAGSWWTCQLCGERGEAGTRGDAYRQLVEHFETVHEHEGKRA